MATVTRLTDAGAAALQQAITNGEVITIESLQLGQGQYVPTGAETALDQPFTPPRIFRDLRGSHRDNVLKHDFLDSSTDAYNAWEAGLFSSDGVLMFIAANEAADGPLLQKLVNTDIGLSWEWALSNAQSPTIEFTGSGFPVVIADENTPGLSIRVASTTPLTDNERHVTPEYLKTQLDNFTPDAVASNDITHVAPGNVIQVGNDVRLTPNPPVSRLIDGHGLSLIHI